MRILVAAIGAVILLTQMDWPVKAQEEEPRVLTWKTPCPLSLCAVQEPVLRDMGSGSWNVFIGPYAGWAVSRQSHLTHIGRDSVVTWHNEGNGPDRWSPVILYVWWPDGSGGLMVNRKTGEVRRCGPPDAAMVKCLPAGSP